MGFINYFTININFNRDREKKMNVDVSVIVPVYNVEKLLPRCINSIINQSLKNIEIILINDGSTDNSGRVCKDFAKLDKRIKVIHQQNGGLSDARNAGLDVAKGNFIAFVDSDDFIHENMYEILLRTMIENDCEVVESGYQRVFPNDIINNYDQPKSKRIFNTQAAVVNTIMDHHCRNYVWNKLYKKELWDDIRFPYGKLFEDVSTTYQVVNMCSKLVKIDCELYYYYQREGSISRSKFSIKKTLDHCKALQAMMEFMEEKHDEAAPITCIKYYATCLFYLQELIINRKKYEDSDILIKKLRSKLLNDKYSKYLKGDINSLSQQILTNDYEILSKHRTRIKHNLFFLRVSIRLFYIFNKSIEIVHSSKYTLKNYIKTN